MTEKSYLNVTNCLELSVSIKYKHIKDSIVEKCVLGNEIVSHNYVSYTQTYTIHKCKQLTGKSDDENILDSLEKVEVTVTTISQEFTKQF